MYGAGAPLVLISGLTTTQQLWTPDLLHAVAATRKVVIFDNRGIGASYDSDAPGSLTITSYGESTLELIAALDLDRPDVMGWSLGGLIALWIATNAGEAINHIILASTGSNGKGYIPGPALFSEVFPLVVGGEGMPIPPAYYFPDTPEGNEALCRVIAFGQAKPEDAPTPRQIKDQFAGIQSGLADDSIYYHLGNITNPVLIIAGVQDLLTDYHSSYTLEQMIPDAFLLKYKNAGHGVIFQDALLVSPLIINFLDD